MQFRLEGVSSAVSTKGQTSGCLGVTCRAGCCKFPLSYLALLDVDLLVAQVVLFSK